MGAANASQFVHELRSLHGLTVAKFAACFDLTIGQYYYAKRSGKLPAAKMLDYLLEQKPPGKLRLSEGQRRAFLSAYKRRLKQKE